ncbi:hypothetical protein CPB83DRAFT_823511 [Crepidotus variabilis]|uniref:C2H2-type domain-containing protein n=1 Tax=Crepidotus variabilis TaxID=179855 RepID=A0A9P6JHM4_9AGAR|nr:hypothetical protein CPB83DRAFT_823511 [Crepidotus variabilis]
MNHEKYTPSTTWNPASQYPAHAPSTYTHNIYTSTSSLHMAHGSPSPQTPSGMYDQSPRAIQSNYPSGYYANATNYSPNSPTTSQLQYSPVTPTSPTGYGQTSSLRSGANIQRPQSTAPSHYYSHSSSHSYSSSNAPYTQSPSSPITGYQQMGRPRSHSQVQKFPPSSSPYQQPQFVEVPIPQTIAISSDTSSSPQRPYSCDLCALSFNRQHDLKRHRETHTGEKPYLCNGGCGKTFTRKDALKRHQVCAAT